MTPVSSLFLAAGLALGLATSAMAQDSPAGPGHEVMTLWPKGPPGAEHATAREEIISGPRTPPFSATASSRG